VILGRWFVRRAVHEREMADLEAALEQDALLALSMMFADADPHGWGWDERAREVWAEVHDG
jgi:hypothetical protein